MVVREVDFERRMASMIQVFVFRELGKQRVGLNIRSNIINHHYYH